MNKHTFRNPIHRPILLRLLMSALFLLLQIRTGYAGSVVVSGAVHDVSGSALEGVTLRISNTTHTNLPTNPEGHYSVTLDGGGPYMVTPSRPGCVFDPPYVYLSSPEPTQTIHFTATVTTNMPFDRIAVHYYPNWAVYARNFHVHDIPVEFATHINYAFLMPFCVPGDLAVDDKVEYRTGQNGNVIAVRHAEGHSVGLAITDLFADIQKFVSGSYIGDPGPYPDKVATWLAITNKSRGVLGQLIQLKKQQQAAGKDLHLLASAGGWTLGQHLPHIATNAALRAAFGLACHDFLDATGFDGVDIDWEFPVSGGTDGTETINGQAIPPQPHTTNDPIFFLALMKDIREAIGTNHLLTMASAQSPNSILQQYVWPGTRDEFGATNDILDYLDFVTVMTYDYGGYWSDFTSHVAPLHKDAADPAYAGTVGECMDLLLAPEGGAVPPERLVMGLPFYGKIWKDIAPGPAGDGLYQTNTRPGRVFGSWDRGVTPSEASTTLDFADLKFGKAASGFEHQYLNMPASGFVEYWNDTVKCPYLYNPVTRHFISFEDENSMAEKVRFVNSRKLAGCMIWETTQDAYGGYLAERVYREMQATDIRIAGRVLDASEAGVAGVTVTLTETGAPTQQVTTAEGTFAFEGLTPGHEYTLNFSKDASVFLPQSLSWPALAQSQNLTILCGSAFHSISGSAASGGIGRDDVSVELRRGETTLASLLTSAGGHYLFSNVLAGFDYILNASLLHHQATPPARTLTNLSANQTGMDFDMNVALYRIGGQVTQSPSGSPLDGIPVHLGGSQSGIYTTDPSGAYQTVLLPATGTYTVAAQSDEGHVVPESRSFNGLSGNATANFSIETGIRVHGYVKDGSAPLSGITVVFSAQVADWYWKSTTTDSSGYYLFNDVPSGAPNAYLLLQDWQGIFYPSNRVDLGTVVATVLQDFNKQPVDAKSSITGRVMRDGAGLPGVAVALSNLTSGAIAADHTDSAGVYLFEQLTASNDYLISASRSHYEIMPASRQVDNLTEDVQLDDFTATFTGALVSISGTITLTNGTPASGVLATLSGDVTSNRITSAQGEYRFDGLPAGGTYSLRFSGPRMVFSPPTGTFTDLESHAVFNVVTSASVLTPLPRHVIVGYWHNWQLASSPFMPLRDVLNTRFNVCNVSFIETLNQDGVHPIFTVDDGGIGYTAEEFKQDVRALQSNGIPVLISIGGQNGHVVLSSESNKNTFVQGVIAIVEEYGFDGIDIDYEGGSMTAFYGPPNSIEYADITNPELKYGIDAIRAIHAHFGDGFIISAAPELAYVQEGRRNYPGGSQFVPFLHNIRDILSYIHIQYYNFGSSVWGALDGVTYHKGTADLVVAMTDMLIAGFPVGSTATFPGLRPDQVAFGLPCSPNAGNGYMNTNEVIKALNYLTQGHRTPDMTYTIRGPNAPWENLRGIMTWSINWDATTDGGTAPYEFADTYAAYFYGTLHAGLIPNSWKITHFGTLDIQEDDDIDGDSYSNLHEYIADTDPLDASSFFEVEHAWMPNDRFALQWHSASGRKYSIYSGHDLNTGFPSLLTNLFYPLYSWTTDITGASSPGFFRLHVELSE